MVREGRVFKSQGGSGKPEYGAGFQVTAYAVGAEVSSPSIGTTVDVRGGHGFVAGDKFIVGTDESRYRTVLVANEFSLEIDSNVPLSDRELLVNLGDDPGTLAPQYASNSVQIFVDMDYSNLYANSTVLTDNVGRYRYHHMGLDLWELVRTPAGAPFAIYTDAGSSAIVEQTLYDVRHASQFATSGAGTPSDPWLGWEAAFGDGLNGFFDPGTYATDDLQIGITASNVACNTSVLGAGAGVVNVIITSSTGQVRVYGAGSGTRVLQGVRVGGFTVTPGATNASSGLVSLENFEMSCWADDIYIDVGVDFIVQTGIYFKDCSHTTIGVMQVRGYAIGTTALSCTTGVEIYTTDGIQRGNIHFDSLDVVNCMTSLKIHSSGGSLNNIDFSEFKAVNGIALDDTMAVDLDTNCEQITFGMLHMEKFHHGLDALSVENLVVENGIASQIHNVANTAGAAFNIVNGDSGRIFCRVDTCYDGFLLSGTTTRYVIQKSAAGAISGTYFSDTSSGDNVYLSGLTFTTLPGKPVRFATPLSDDTVIELITTAAAQKSPRLLFSPSTANMNLYLEVSATGILNVLNNSGATVCQINQTGDLLAYGYLRATSYLLTPTIGTASTDVTTNVGRMVFRTVSVDPASVATLGTLGEVVYSSSTAKFYGKHTTSASDTNWRLLGT